MHLDDVILESLLHQEEGPALDFKGYQYPFDKASVDEKSELLKDILAFANTKRETTAYILIGVVEVKGGRSKIVGVMEHLDDARLHQFVNSKIQCAVEFSYTPYPLDGTEIGVIEIPSQNGLFHLRNNYGKLQANLVYIRDGSSTRSATPVEIIEMTAPKRPELVLAWADSESSSILPSPYTVNSLILSPTLPNDTFQLAPTPDLTWNGVKFPSLSLYDANPDYSQGLIKYTFCKAGFAALGLQLHNESGVAATRVRYEGTLTMQDGIAVLDKFPPFPQKTIYRFRDLNIPPLSLVHEAWMELQKDSEGWKISVEFGDIRPGEVVNTKDTLWFGSRNSGIVKLEGKLLGENISEPILCTLEIRFEAECRPMTVEDVQTFQRAHFVALDIDDE